MTSEIGSCVRWTKFSPTRLGYKASDIGKVVRVRGVESARELDVQFDDGNVVRGACEHWFERVYIQTQGELQPVEMLPSANRN